jgi:hypothetical protein
MRSILIALIALFTTSSADSGREDLLEHRPPDKLLA